MIEVTCTFTGHRPKTFPWGYDETARGCVLLKKLLAEQIGILADRGVTDFLSGMALGTDLWCSQVVLDLKQNIPAIKLHCILPCEGQESKWTVSSQEQYRSILKQADDVFYVNRTYHANCMLERNRYMVDHSSILFAVYNGALRSGTGSTVRYARQMGKTIYILNPVTWTITKESVENRKK